MLIRVVARRAFTLAELLFVLLLGGIMLGIISSIGARLQRALTAESARVAVDEQLAAGAEVLPIDLRGLSPAADDIVATSARDTSLEIRATIGNAIACASAPGTVTLAFHRGPGGRIVAPRTAAGDTLWLLEDTDDGEQWRAVPLTALRRASGVCGALDPSADQVVDRGNPWAADIGDTATVQSGALVRITRPERFSFYRASDGEWYLGLRGWNSGVHAFNGVQPIAGPFRSPLSARGAKLSYFDSAGSLIAAGSADTRRIARIEVLLAADSAGRGSTATTESLTVVAALRNRDD